MTREQAEALIENLLQASYDYERSGGKDYRKELFEIRQRVVEALCPMPPEVDVGGALNGK